LKENKEPVFLRFAHAMHRLFMDGLTKGEPNVDDELSL
jgi:hypothetical protein